MDHMKFETPDMTTENIDRIAELFPNCITEMRDESGKLKRGINFEMLKQMLSPDVVDGDECYEFTWVGKKASIVEANKPIRKTLRPCPEESKNWDTTENLYIEGDNLEVLKLLQESYLGKVKMIYIDPPYNTGHDFIYNDRFEMDKQEYQEQIGLFDEEGNKQFAENPESNPRFHSDWCSMMYPRLMLARNMLADGGVIIISIDDSELENLRKICDEIYGADNFVNCFIWNCSTAGGIRPKFASKTHEYLLCYAKSKNDLEMFFAPLSSDAIKMYTQRDERGIYRDKDFVFKNKSTNVNQKYPIVCPDGETVVPKEGYIYRFVEERFKESLKNGMVTFKRTVGGPLVTTAGMQANWNIYIKKYLGDATGAPATLIPKEMMSIYNVGTQCVQDLFDGVRVFDNAKPVDVVVYLTKMVSAKDSIVLDFFSGSATTAHAVMLQNFQDVYDGKPGKRKFIMVQWPEKCDEKSEAYKAGYKNICEIGKERIRRAGEKELMDIKATAGSSMRWGQERFDEFGNKEMTPDDVDIGFRVFKLDDSNMKDVYYTPDEIDQDMIAATESNIKEDRTDLDLLFGCLLDWGLPLSMPYYSETIDGCTVHTYDPDSGAYPNLIACFNENIPDTVIKEIARRKPVRAVFRDASFTDSPEKINVFEVFKIYMPEDADDITKRVKVL